MAVANWSDSEVINLIELWGEEGIQEQLEGAKRNKHVYEKLGRELQKTGREGRSTWKFIHTMHYHIPQTLQITSRA